MPSLALTPSLESDEVVEWKCQIDDSSGEAIANTIEIMLNAGALDAYAQPIVMKKGRPAWRLTILCHPSDAHATGQLLLSQSSSIGIRKSTHPRLTLPRRIETRSITIDQHTADIRFKIVTLPSGRERAKPRKPTTSTTYPNKAAGASKKSNKLRQWQH